MINSYLMFELVCGNASHAVGRVRVCFSLWCCDLTDIPLADWSDTAAEWEYYGFWFAVLFALSFPRPPSHWHNFYHFGDLCNTIFLSFSFSTLLSGSLSYIFNVCMIFTSLVSCLSSVCLSLFNSFILVNVYILYLLSFSFVMLFFFNSLKLLMFTFSHFLRVCLKSSELPNIGSYILRQHTNWKETF